MNLRGIELIDKVIEYIKSGKSDIKIPVPQPVSKKLLDKARIKGDLELSPSMKRFMEFDVSWFANRFEIFDDTESLEFAPVSVAIALRDGLNDDVFWTCFKKLPSPMPQSDCLPLDTGSETMRILFLGIKDKYGEYPVLNLDIDDTPCIDLAASGFDIWLAGYSGLIPDTSVYYKNDNEETSKSLFSNTDGLDCDYCDEMEDENEEDAAEEKPKNKSKKKIKITEENLAKMSKTDLENAFADSMENKDEEIAKSILNELQKRYPEEKKWKKNAVYQAIFSDNTEYAKILIELGAKPDNEDLWLACHGRSAEMIRLVVDSGAEINSKGKDRGYPLDIAAEHNNIDAVKYLLDHGAIARPSSFYDAISQFYSRKNGEDDSIEILKLLIKAGGKIDDRTEGGWTPLIQAVENGLFKVLKFLIDQGADINAVDYKGSNSILVAWEKDRKEIFDYLVLKGASKDIRNDDGISFSDIFDETGKFPKKFQVRLFETASVQTIKARIKFYFPVPRYDDDIHVAPLFNYLENLVKAGIAGSNKFAPDFSDFEWIKNLPKKPGKPDMKSIKEFSVEFKVKGISSEAFSVWILNFFKKSFSTKYAITELEITGETDDKNAILIDTEKAKKWIENGMPEKFSMWKEIPFETTESKAGKICHVETEIKMDEDIPYCIENAVRNTALYFKEFDIKSKYSNDHIWIDLKSAGEKIDFTYRYLGGNKNEKYNCNIELTKILFINAFIKADKKFKVKKFVWSLGVEYGISEPTSEPDDDQSNDNDKIEVSPSNRATCKGCKKKIDKGILRFAFETEFESYNYFHLECAAKKKDKRFKKAIDNYKGEIPDKDKLLTLASSAKSGGSPSVYPYAEHAKTSRSKCIKCGKAIEKDGLRIAIEREYESSAGGMMTGTGYLHVECAKDWENISLDSVLKNSLNLDEKDKNILNKELV
jgi:ankyrin repeat protein